MKFWLKTGAVAAIVTALSTGATCPRRAHESVFSTENLLRARAEKLEKTIVTAHFEEPIVEGKNVLWCSTFQLAWNEACDLIGEDIHLAGEPPMAAILNRKTATKDDLDDTSYVALAGWVRDGIYNRIRAELDRKFKGEAAPKLLDLIPRAGVVRPQDIVSYAYLFKNLEFAKPFEKIARPLLFDDREIECFGVSESKTAPAKMLGQVLILDYSTEHDFIIELRSKSEADRIILAKTTPQATLEATISAVNSRIRQTPPFTMRPRDVLKVPKLNFDIRRTYSELYGRHLIAANPKVAKDLLILIAIQDIRFQMDEKGVRLRSEAVIGFGCSAPPPPGLLLIFDKPFLIMLKRVGRNIPYFALWVDNPELLVKHD